MEEIYLRDSNFLQRLVCDFGRIDVEINSVLSEKMNFPPLETPKYITEWIQEMSLGATNFPKLGIIFKLSRDSEKFFLPDTSFH